MIAQRAPGAAPVIAASAENLPVEDDSFDAAMAVNTVHHWAGLEAGLREMRRVARKRVVIFLRSPAEGMSFWLAEYLPALDTSKKMRAVATIGRVLGPVRRVAVPLPADCVDGVFSAFWARPEMYLDASVRRNMSNFALAADDYVAVGLARLETDLATGRWDRRHGRLRTLAELDLGYRLLIAERETAQTHAPACRNVIRR
jgi:SAM-dependent methyltransferase